MNRVAALLHGAKLVGSRNTLRAFRFALARRRADRRLARLPASPRRTPGRVLGTRLDGTAVRVRFENAELELRFAHPGQVSVGWDGALSHPSYAVVAELDDGPVPSLEQAADGWVARGAGIEVRVGPAGGLSYLTGAGDLRRRDDPPVWDGVGWTLRSHLAPGSGVHGLGGRPEWPLRDTTYRCWNTDPGGAWLPHQDPLDVTTPVWAAIDDLGVVHCFVDNPWDGTVEVGHDSVVMRFEAGPTRWHVSTGSLAEVTEAFTWLTGRPTPAPRWALGFHQARWGYGSAAAVREVWSGFRRHDLPLSAVHVDIDHMDRFRDFTFGDAWQEMPELVKEMAADGVQTVVIVDSGVAKADDYPAFHDGLARDVFCRAGDGSVFQGVVWPGPTVFPDFTAPDARRWWGEQLAFYVDRGVAGYWHDMNEPSCFVAFGEPTFPLSVRHALDGRPGDHREAHNSYGLQMCRASYDGLLALRPDARPFLFSRSGWAGIQRYGGHWSGDIQTDWSSLLGTVHQAFSCGLSGVGYYGSDIGGFTGEPSPELFTRWFQLASFLPLFRTHCAFDVPRREPWEWDPDVTDRLRDALRRRYRLLPHWYTLTLAAARDGAPLVRPMAWEDPRLRGVTDQFLLGEDVVVAPVLVEGAKSRRVRLPDGVWFHGDTGEPAEGVVDQPVGPGDLPWFVRAGAVLPTEDSGRLVLLVAPPLGLEVSAGGRLLTDAGDGWEAPHEERYTAALDGDAVVVTREVVSAGVFEFERREVLALDGRPARLE